MSDEDAKQVVAAEEALRAAQRFLPFSALLSWSACSTPPPPIGVQHAGRSAPVVAAVVATEAAILQAAHGCTMGGCGPAYECDRKTRLCKPLSEGNAARSHPKAMDDGPACAASSDGLVTICLSSVSAATFQLRAQNGETKPVVLALRELHLNRALSCSPLLAPAVSSEARTSAGAPLPSIKPGGMRLLPASGASEPRPSLFLAPGPARELEIAFELDGPNPCGLELTASFEVAQRPLTLTLTLPARQTE